MHVIRCFSYMLLLAFSFSLIAFDFIVFATTNVSPLQQHPTVHCHEHDKSALLRFKQSFLIDCGVASYPALPYPKVNLWHELDDCCNWDGVHCDRKTGRVIKLDLSNSCLYGTLSPNNTLFDLDHLSELNLAGNHFNHSQIPSAIGKLNKLTHLDLSESGFSGKIPSEIYRLASLSILDLSLNLKLHDISLEKLVSNSTRLKKLILSYVDISSTVPLILGNRSSLEVIALESCNLFGEFPSNIFLLRNLKVLSLFFNLNLGGHLPEFHSDSPMSIMTLYGTMFSGGLPSSLGKLCSLRVMLLHYCEFSGKIPSSIGNMTKLTSLTLSYNFLSGDLPMSITNLTHFTRLELSDVIITELMNFNSWLSKLKLTNLALAHMSLGKVILHPLRNLTKLYFLDLSQNELKGQVPHWFVNLTQLTYLNMFSNQLQGPIPSWISHLINLQGVWLSFNRTVGMIDSFLKLPNLKLLHLSGLTPLFPSNISTNASFSKLEVMAIESCNLREFPEFLLRHQDRLQRLVLSGSNIRGKIPQWLVNSTTYSLLELDLSNNHITGFEQPLVFLPWNKLEILKLNDNKFQGPLLSPPRTIQYYKVSNNTFSGDISNNICYVTSLIYLDLSDNKLSGHIPNCIFQKHAATLQILNLRNNNFSGISSQTLSTSCNLRMINLSQNQIGGTLPRSITNCLMLEVLDVGRNHISDTFPNWLGSLLSLRVLILRHNNFHGNIIAPLHSHYFQGLRIIDLSYNFFTGNLPGIYIQSWLAMADSAENFSNSSHSFFRFGFHITSFSRFGDEMYNYSITISNKGVDTLYSRILTVFRVIDFSSNQFTGSIPNVIGNLRGLQALNLSNNNLVGSIPSSLSNIIDLEALDLSQNMLTGEIPQTLAMLTSLELFNVSHNQLVGPIPQAKQFSTFDASSFEGNLALCGAQLSIKCENLNSLPPSPSSKETLINDRSIGWIIRSLGYASGFIIGFVIGKLYVTDRYHDWFMETFGGRGMPKARARRLTLRHRLRYV